ncbi:hypothetical protein QWY93_01070 [Echinicola jeungdonensis]|uniref:Uncharacterized protein n=1 Tax=Echinicola jeungdonensis TaxID=709343 RepID=A0ABV5J6C2_9BACT|nr:hypothetical protein [Echinicola jeungdonensis]MDN3667932.1 hypothetical protein [Echinicola jeungdonensis]
MNNFVTYIENNFSHFKLISLFLLGYVLVSHYRPFQNELGFFDFGLADSGAGLVSLVFVYFLLTPLNTTQEKANENAFLVLFIYLSQELFCYFFPGLIGSFDFKDMLYYCLGFILVYCFDMKSRGNIAH